MCQGSLPFASLSGNSSNDARFFKKGAYRPLCPMTGQLTHFCYVRDPFRSVPNRCLCPKVPWTPALPARHHSGGVFASASEPRPPRTWIGSEIGWIRGGSCAGLSSSARPFAASSSEGARSDVPLGGLCNREIVIGCDPCVYPQADHYQDGGHPEADTPLPRATGWSPGVPPWRVAETGVHVTVCRMRVQTHLLGRSINLCLGRGYSQPSGV